MTDSEALQQARAQQAETDELVSMLRDRCTALRAALHRTAQELADARQQLADQERTDDDESE